MKTKYILIFIVLSIIAFGQNNLDELAIKLNGSTSTEEAFIDGVRKRRIDNNLSISSWEKDYLNKKIKNSTNKKEKDSLEKLLNKELEFERILLEQEKQLELQNQIKIKIEQEKQQKIKVEKEHKELMIKGAGISILILVLFGFGIWKLFKNT